MVVSGNQSRAMWRGHWMRLSDGLGPITHSPRWRKAMVKRALIIGSQTGGLNGVHADVDAIREALERFAFKTPDIRTGDNASREGILAGYEALIADHRPEDAALIYYSGHGGRALNPSQPEGSPPQYLQFLVPTDF